MSKYFYFKQFSSTYVQFQWLKTVQFQTIQFSRGIQFQLKKTVPFLAIQFCISTQFRSIWPIDRNLSGASTVGQSGPGSDGKAPILLEPHHQIVLCHIQHTRWRGHTPMQICSRCILQPQSTGQTRMYKWN